MACRWRIRHKLMLGLGLVLAILALLLAGTFRGLWSYHMTMKSIDSKLAELKAAEDLKTAVSELATADETSNLAEEFHRLRTRTRLAREKLAAYEEKLQDTIARRRDPDRGFQETALIEALRERFTRLDETANKATRPEVLIGVASQPLLKDDAVQRALHDLAQTSADLRNAIYEDLGRRINESRGHYRGSLWIVISTSVVGVLLMACLLRFFYGWVFYPVRDLEQGAGRVAHGDFGHRIEVKSGDEMEDLAAAFNDMTTRLRDMYTDLERQVNERSRQLVRSERLASVGFLAAGVAHEINNPLASIAFCSEALDARLSELLGPKSRGRPAAGPRPGPDPMLEQDYQVVAKYLKMIQEEAFRCKKITTQLLKFSRSGDRHREPTDLAELVQSVLDMVEHLQTRKGKQIAFAPQLRVTAWINAQEVRSVVLNLVVNALESMDDGGTLSIVLGHREEMAELRFTDTGCGMNAEVLENIFEPFFTRSRTGKGTGLGLTISHRIITQHGGEIEAASPGPGRGSTFTVRLPMQPVVEKDAGARNQESAVGVREAADIPAPARDQRRAA